MSALLLHGGQVLLEDGLRVIDLGAGPDGLELDPQGPNRAFDARGLLVLPGIVDLHGDAFERQLQPRPGIGFLPGLALADTESQLLGCGITTAYHGVTLSWEPGLRGIEAWRAWLGAMEAHASRAVCDMRIHLRFEAHALDVADEAQADIAAGRVHLLSFNDHLPEILRKLADPVTGAKFAARGPLALPAFRALAERVAAGASGISAARDRLAAAARTAGLPMASHDDATLAARDGFRALGARICDFPMNEAVARAATEAGDAVLMGCPNVVRGGSHLGWASAATMAETGLCSVLASDYFYPAMLPAAFVLAARGRLDLAAAWAMLSANPARAAGLVDRGRIAEGLRADLVVVDARGTLPHVVATVAAGRLAWLGAQGAALLGG